MPFALTPERDRELSEILTRYPTRMAACIPALHLCQDQNGWVSDEVIDFVARKLDLPPAHVKGVVTFYTLFNQHPVGKHQVWVCRTLPCALRGAGDVLSHCEKKLGIKPGQTTPDGKITLRTAECLASCGTAPMMQVDKDYHENLTLERVDQILESLTAGKPVAPSKVSVTGVAGAGTGAPAAARPLGASPASAPPRAVATSTAPPTAPVTPGASASSKPPGPLPPPTPPPAHGSRPPGPVVASRPPAPAGGAGSSTPPAPPKSPVTRPPQTPADAPAHTAPSAEKTSSTAPPRSEDEAKKKDET